MENQTLQSTEPGTENSISSTNPKGLTDWILVFLFAFIVIVMTVSIFYRYVLNSSLSWSDEVLRFSFVWFTFLGSVILFRDNTHIRIDFLRDKMSPKMLAVTEKFGRFMVAGFYLFLLVAGIIWVFETQGTQMSSLRLPLNLFFYSAVPVTSAIALYYVFFGKDSDESKE
jgi:TRAP-type C4-dicarboxylate transport system permease small subunit